MAEERVIGYPPAAMPMRSLRIRQFATLGLALALTACPATSPELRRGDSFASRGLWRQATESYAAALERDSRDPLARTRLAEAEKQLAADLATRIEPALNLGELDQADELFLEAERLHPALATLDPLRPRLARAWLDEVVEGTGAGDLGRAFHAADRAATLSPDDAEARSVRSAAHHAYSDELSRDAERFERQALPGNALCALLRLQQVAPDDHDVASRIIDARVAARAGTGFVTEVQVTAGAGARRRIAAELVSSLSSLEDNATCEGLSLVRVALAGPGASLRLAVDNYSILSRRTKRQEKKSYVAGSRRVVNPGKAEAAAAAKAAKAKLEEGVTELKAAMAAASEQEVAFAEAPPEADTEGLRRALSDARQTAQGARQAAEEAARNLAAARRRLADTPAKIDQPIEKEADLEITEVTRRAELELRLSATDLGSGKKVIDNTTLRTDASTQDTTHPALPRAEVEADPLDFPRSDAELEKTVLDQMSRMISEKVLGLCQTYSEELISAPTRLPANAPLEEQTETWVRAVLRSKGELPAAAGSFFSRAWGLSDPKVLRED